MKKWDDYLIDFFCFVFCLLLGINIAGQFFYGTATFFFAILCATVMLTHARKWGPIDLLLLRRWVVIVGLATLLSIYVTGLVFTHGLIGIAAETILAAGMRTIPVYTTIIIATLVTLFWHYCITPDSKPGFIG